MEHRKIANHCGGCQEFRISAWDEERNVALGFCTHNPRPGSIQDTSPKCLAYRPFPEVSASSASPSGAAQPTKSDSTSLGMAKDTLRSILRDVLNDLLGPEEVELGDKWTGGRMVLEPGRAGVLGKEVPIEAFFNKIIMVRDRLRVLEAKLNAHPSLSGEEKLEFQSYITKCYGSLTTFNVLFAHEADKFIGEKKSR